MTRFARAKGSKSSNSRTVEEATDWNEFKSQTDPAKTDSINENSAMVKKTIKLIKEGGPKESGWADFGGSSAETEPLSKKAKKRKQKKALEEQGEQGPKKKAKVVEDASEMPDKLNVSQESSNGTNKKSKKDKKKKLNKSTENGDQTNDKPEGSKKQSNDSPANGTDKPAYRRKPFVQFTTFHINGAAIKISKFEGFDIKHEDAVRLKEMRIKMKEAGIPKTEIDFAIKKERRNAEKALSRERKKVCFNCRKSGHPLSECPELGAVGFNNVETTGTSQICYKCGSTEHTHYQCQVKKNKEYSFATCFICKEQGHISSQCPDNPKGLYPQGGCCKICGEVTHLKKDCPSLAKDRTESAVTLDTLASTSNVESLDANDKKPKPFKKAAKQKKIVKF